MLSSSRDGVSVGREPVPELSLVYQHGPHDTGGLIGLCHTGDIRIAPCCQTRQPTVTSFRFIGRMVQYRARTMHQQTSQIAVATLTDPLEPFLAAT